MIFFPLPLLVLTKNLMKQLRLMSIVIDKGSLGHLGSVYKPGTKYVMLNIM